MVKLVLYKCDRCGKEFKREEEAKISGLVIKDEDFNKETTSKELCIDCMANFWSWIEYDEEHDKLASSLVKE